MNMIAPYLYLDQPDSLRLDGIYSLPAQCYDSTDAFIEIFAPEYAISYSIDSTFQASNEFYNVAPDSLYSQRLLTRTIVRRTTLQTSAKQPCCIGLHSGSGYVDYC